MDFNHPAGYEPDFTSPAPAPDQALNPSSGYDPDHGYNGSMQSTGDDVDLSSGLHTVGKHPLSLTHVFLGIKLQNKKLTDISQLSKFSNLLYVDISDNTITNLSVFSRFPMLLQLNASKNQIEHCLAFSPEKCDSTNAWSSGHEAVGSMLTLANLSENRIRNIGDLSHHPFLECLLLRSNQLSSLHGLLSLKYLKVLDVSDNSIDNIEGLDFLPIQELNISKNRLVSLNGLKDLPNLSVLNASNNFVSSLSPLAECMSLTRIDLQNNQLETIRQTEHLQDLPWLQSLQMSGNEFCKKQHYRQRVIFRLPRLCMLDRTTVSTEEKIRSSNLYKDERGDLQLRQDVFQKYFPGENFADFGPQFEDDEYQIEI